MGDISAMTATMNTASDIELFREDLVALKRDVASLIEHFTGEVGAGFKASPIKLRTALGASLRTLPRTASKPPRRLAFGSNGDLFYRLALRWELVTSVLARSLGEAVPHCARFHQTCARRGPVQDHSADTPRSVDDQSVVRIARRAKMGGATTSQPARECPWNEGKLQLPGSPAGSRQVP